jgi:daunorubicin resistance ABC transporter ATP-binding subunit
MTDQAIAIEGLSKRFGAIVALDDINLEVARGTVFGLLGPNGAGKTTCVRILTTIIRPDSGRALVLGHDVVREAGTVRCRIGLAGQYAAVDGNLTGRENLRLIGRLTHSPRREIPPRANDLLRRFGLADAADRLVRTYSGGMRRRLDLAAALVHRPEVVFLDEPTTGLDPEGRLQMWAVIRELVRDGTTVLLTTQYLEEADRLANHLVVIDRGRIIAEGTPATLKARLGSTVVEVQLADEQQVAKAKEMLAQVNPESEGKSVRFSTSDGARPLVEMLCSLEDAGLKLANLTVREPSLDDAFLALTGEHATSGESGDDPATEGGT